MIKDWTKEQLEKIVSNSYSIADCLRKMGYSGTGETPKKLNILIERYGIDTSHFRRKRGKNKTNKEVFRKGSIVSQATLRTRFKDVCEKYECYVCGLQPEWNGKPLTLMLDHIDGCHENNELSNLRWVCPNCNSQLPTTGYHGRKYDKFGRPIVTDRIPIVDEHAPENRNKIKCPKCGRLMSRTAEMCKHCLDNEKREKAEEDMPVTRNELKDLIRTKSFTAIGEQFGMSDNAIRKWCKRVALPISKKEIKSYTDDQWRRI